MTLCCIRCRETYGEEHNAPCEARQRSESTTPKRQKVDDDPWTRRGGEAAATAAVRDEGAPQAEADDHAIPGRDCYDQAAGERLDPEEVADARKEEIDRAEEHEA